MQNTFCQVSLSFRFEILEYKGSHVLTITPAYHIERSVFELNRSLSNERAEFDTSDIEPKNEKSQKILESDKIECSIFELNRSKDFNQVQSTVD